MNTTWTFLRDQHWAVLGPNGSGKSWFADALRGRIPLIHGELRYGFRTPRGLSPEEVIGHVGFEDRKSDLHGTVVQSRWNSLEDEAALHVDEFLSYERVMDINPFEVNPASGGGEAAFRRRRRRAVALMSVEPFLGRTLVSLSNGERQRVQWARALCHPLRLLILDEPFTGLDAEARRHFYSLLEKLMETQLRILFVTTRAEDLPRGITHVLEVDRCQVVAARGKVAMPKSQVPGSRLVPSLSSAGSQLGYDGPGAKVLVELRGVTVRYGERAVLKGVDWTVRAGESWALLGANGAGKSTLLSLVLGDNPQAYSNHVTVFGRRRGEGESIWQLKRHIGWVSPELHLHFNEAVSCLEVVASAFRDTIGLFEPATSRQRVLAKAWLNRFGMLGFARSSLSALSLGQQRIVLLARALVKTPRLLILDEPCQGLDGEHRDLFLSAIDGLIRTRAVTAIYVTHRPDEIPKSITRVLRLVAGRATTAGHRFSRDDRTSLTRRGAPSASQPAC